MPVEKKKKRFEGTKFEQTEETFQREQEQRKRERDLDVRRLRAEGKLPPEVSVEEKVEELKREREPPPLPEVFQPQPTIDLTKLPAREQEPTIEPAQVPTEEEGIVGGVIQSYKDVQKMAKEGKIVMGAVPLGGIPVPSTAVATAATKAKIYSAMVAKTAKWGALLFGARTVVNIPETRMRDDLAEMRIMKTDLGRTALKNINLGEEFAWLVLDELDIMEAELNKYEREIKKEDIRSYTSRFFGTGKFGETQKYIESLRKSIVPIRELAYRKLAGVDVSEEVALQSALIEAEIVGEGQ